MKILKKAAKTRKVAAAEILSALSVIEKAKIDYSGFLETLGGSESRGRTWMLIFTAEVDKVSSFFICILMFAFWVFLIMLKCCIILFLLCRRN